MADKIIYSDNHKQYLLNIKKDERLIKVFQFSVMILFLIIWEFAGYMGWIDTFIFSTPISVVSCFIKMISENELIIHILVTLKEVLMSFILMMSIGIVTAVLLWRFNRLSSVLEPFIVVLNSIPKSALAPLMLVWFGANQTTIIVSGISVGVFGAILNIYAGFLKVDKEQVKLITTLGGGKKDALLKVIIPSTMPILISVMKVNIGLSLVGVVIGEFFASNTGLGYLIIYGGQVFKLDMLIMSIVILCILTVIFYRLIFLLEKSILKIFHM